MGRELTDRWTDRLLEASEPGRVLMLSGRPAAGVSTSLASATSRWATTGKAAVACWERPPALLVDAFPDLAIAEVPYIVGWTLDELAGWLRSAMVSLDDVLLAIDYLQLIEGSDETCAEVAALARACGLRILLGAMSTRAVIPAISDDAPPDDLLQAFAEDIDEMRGGDRRHVHRLAVIVESEPSQPRRLILSQASPDLAMVDSVHDV